MFINITILKEKIPIKNTDINLKSTLNRTRNILAKYRALFSVLYKTQFILPINQII